MHFGMFRKFNQYGAEQLYCFLLTDEGVSILNELKQSYNKQLFRPLLDNIIASIILEKQTEPCNDGFMLSNWASSQRGAGKILLMNIFNHGITLYADRYQVSSLARAAILKMSKLAKTGTMIVKPLDNESRPVTPDREDDCMTYTNTGGYMMSNSGEYISKLDVDSSGLDIKDYMDFSASFANPSYSPPSVITQEEIDKMGYSSVKTIENAIMAHFTREITSSTNQRGRYGNIQEVKIKITKRKLRRLIRESIKDQEEFDEYSKQISKAFDQIKKDNPEVDFRSETHSMPADVAQRKVTGLRRDMKRLWNEKADHSYFQDPSKFICVHYIAGNSSVTRGIESFFKDAKPKAKNTFELSTIGYASMKDVGKGGFMGRKFGFILSPRRVTYAAHSDIGSENTGIQGFSKAGEEQRKQMEKEIISKLPLDVQNDPVKRHQVVTNILRQKLFGSSGSAKRPMLSGGAPVFDEEDVKRALKVPGGILSSTDIIAEVICDNWTASTFVLPSNMCGELYLDWDKLAKYGLKYYVYDTGENFENKENMPEKYKQEAAKRLQRRKENEEYFASIAKKKAEAEAQKAQAEKDKQDKDIILKNNPEAADVEFIGDDPDDYVLVLERLLKIKGINK
jgi:hypothetical protein